MKQLVKVLSILLLILWLCEARKRASSDKQRQGKVFSLFNIVTFKNDECVSTETQSSGSTQFKNGTCYTNSECTSRSGSAKGQCASGFGVCCIITLSVSGGEINQNATYIQNPGFPSGYSETTDVTYKINKCQEDICQLRLDFEYFNINGPSDSNGDFLEALGGACSDTFTVTSSFNTGQQIPTICGTNTGQHMYIEMGPGSEDMVTLDINLDTIDGIDGTGERKWEIKVLQIPCPTVYQAEDSCLQYQTGRTGQFKTFNYDATGETHLADQKYTWCVRQLPGHCCIRWKVCSEAGQDPEDGGFSLDLNGAAAGAPIGNNDAACIDNLDYIEIQGVSKQCSDGDPENSFTSKICGNVFGLPGRNVGPPPPPVTHGEVCDCVAPFHVTIVTNGFDDVPNVPPPVPPFPGGNGAFAPLTSKGTCLEYEQIPCQN